MECIILAAGYATRLYPLTENFPKPLLPVGGKTIIGRVLDDLEKIPGITEYVIVSNHKFIGHFEEWRKQPEQLRLSRPLTVLDDGSVDNDHRLGAAKDIWFAAETLGIAGNAKKADECRTAQERVGMECEGMEQAAAGSCDEMVFVAAGDNVLDFSLAGFLSFAAEKGTSCVMCHEEPELKKLQKTAVITLDENCRITSYEEKPQVPKGTLAVPPFYIYRPEDLRRIPEALAEGCSADAPGSFAAWLSGKVPMHAWKMNGKRYDIGDLKSYEEVIEAAKNQSLS